MRRGIWLLAALALPLAAQAAPSSSLTIAKPWMRYLLPSIPAAGYLTLQNGTDQPATLTGASSPACGMLMLHQTEDNSGMAMMMDVPTLTIPAHGSVSLAPGGYHLMCMSPKTKPGDQVSLTLTFQDGSNLTTKMPVYGPQGGP